jgi:hypothetical protein
MAKFSSTGRRQHSFSFVSFDITFCTWNLATLAQLSKKDESGTILYVYLTLRTEALQKTETYTHYR